jgi:predicted nucleic acid-binding Zn ribbon protein
MEGNNEKQKCSYCGSVNEPDARFCGVCGKRIDINHSRDEKILCQKCGRENELNADFCSSCGERIKKDVKIEKKKPLRRIIQHMVLIVLAIFFVLAFFDFQNLIGGQQDTIFIIRFIFPACILGFGIYDIKASKEIGLAMTAISVTLCVLNLLDEIDPGLIQHIADAFS